MSRVFVLLLWMTGCSSLPTGQTEISTSSFTELYDDYLSQCQSCHSPTAAGRTSDIEMTLDFSTRTTAYVSLLGSASGLTGHQAPCNGAPLIGASAGSSLAYVVLDPQARVSYQNGSCKYVAADDPVNMIFTDTLTDEAAKVPNAVPDGFLARFASWIAASYPPPNN